jgi:hypothetical protein
MDGKQFWFMPSKGTVDAIFFTRQPQEKFLAKGKGLHYAFIDLEKALTRIHEVLI